MASKKNGKKNVKREKTPDVNSKKVEQKKEGSLTPSDVLNEQDTNAQFLIAPFNSEHLKPTGYNLTASNLIISARRGVPLKPKRKGYDIYVDVPKNDTALILTREYLEMPSNIAGSYYSRVRMTSKGFGHISTTLDPTWKGQSLISLSNPTKRKLRFHISSEKSGIREYNTFATLCFTYMRDEENQINARLGNPDARLDILQDLCWKDKTMFSGAMYKKMRKVVEELNKGLVGTVFRDDIDELLTCLKDMMRSLASEDFIKYAQAQSDCKFIKTNDELLRKAIRRVEGTSYKGKVDEETALKNLELAKLQCEKVLTTRQILERNKRIEDIIGISWRGKLFDHMPSFIFRNFFLLVLMLIIPIGIMIIATAIANSLNPPGLSFNTFLVSGIPALIAAIIEATILFATQRRR